jgi:hypothetical protein
MEAAGPPAFARGGEAAALQQDSGRRWLEIMERQVRHRPKLFLGLAFTLGVGLAWLIKRK